jgi:type II secretory ATPase GspE/PulE/Tfp pilus assembly ATPase PilB-like protein
MADSFNAIRPVGFAAKDVTYRPNRNGCELCHYRGYSGRIAMEEVLELWRRDVTRNVWSSNRLRPDWIDVVREQAVAAGMNDMLMQGLRHVKNGITSLDELERFFSADLEALR